MRKKFIFILLFISILVAASYVKTEENFSNPEKLPFYIKNAKTTQNLDQYDAVILWDYKQWIVSVDGKLQEHVHKATKVLTELGVGKYCDPNIYYNEAKQDLHIEIARTYSPDGRIVDTTPNGFNRQTPTDLAEAPAFFKQACMTVTFLGVERGTVLDLEYTLTDKEPWRSHFMGFKEFLADDLPIVYKEILVQIPTDFNFSWEAFGSEVQPHLDQDPKITRYNWIFKDLAGINTERNPAAREEYLPFWIASTSPGWFELSQSLYKEWQAALKKEDNIASGATVISEKVKELCKEKVSVLEQIQTLNDFVAKDLNNVKYDLLNLEGKIRPTNEVYNSSYGYSLEKAALLNVMLDAKDISSSLALPAVASKFSKSVPTTAQFSEAWVLVKLPGSEIWLDPSRSFSPKHAYELADKTIFLISDDKYELLEIPKSKAEDHKMSIVAKVNWESDGTVKISFKAHLTGYFCPFEEIGGTEGNLEGYLKSQSSKFIGSGELKEAKLGYLDLQQAELSWEWHLAKPDAENIQDPKAMSLSISKLVLDNLDFQLWRSQRWTPLYFPCPMWFESQFELNLTKDMEVVYLPNETKEENSKISVSFKVTKLEDNKYQTEEQVKISESVIEPTDYAAFRDILVKFLADSAHNLIVKKKAK